jgi:dihydroorotate dehydrogenase
MHFDYYRVLRPWLFRLQPETAHNIAVTALSKNWLPALNAIADDRLAVCVAGLAFDNPIGLAAGFDKNAACFSHCFRHGFGFAEVGTLTLKAQSGNEKPRMFRLTEDEAIINRLGFNNGGIDAGLANIATQEHKRTGILGINIGKNKDTEHALDDYIPLINHAYAAADYITVNISSPNTQDLRKLQTQEYFADFIRAIMQERNGIAAFNRFKRPIFVKISPDMEQQDLLSLLDTLLTYQVDGVIVNNTTIERSNALKSAQRSQTGGLSGAPLTARSDALTATVYRHTEGKLPIIGVGGIMSGADAVRRIKKGASLVQLYSGLIYRGFGLVQEAKRALIAECDARGLEHVSELTGIEA